MKVSLLLAVVFFAVASYAATTVHPSLPELRLIETAPGVRTWMTEQQVIDTLVAQNQGFIDVTDHKEGTYKVNTFAAEYPAGPKHKAEVDALLPDLKVDEQARTITELSALFNRYYTTETGLQASQLLQKLYTLYADNNPEIEVLPFTHPAWPQYSLVVRIKGSDPELATERVILGGHLDSITTGPNGRAPGADDDASGSSGVLEVFRVLSKNGFKPRRTVEFHAYAAEEVGLKGSQAIAEAYAKQGVKVAGMLQLDMTGYAKPGTIPKVGLVQDYVNKNLTTYIGTLVDAYTSIGWVATTCGYGCSDHASWTKYGYPSAFPFEGTFANRSPYIHTTSDTLANIDLEHAIEFTKLGLAFVVELGLD